MGGEPPCLRTLGADTRILQERLLKRAKLEGFPNQPKSLSANTVAANVAQDAPIRRDYSAGRKGLGHAFLSFDDEGFDVALAKAGFLPP